MSKISVLEQALLQVKNLEEAVKQNAKGILESTMKQELKDLLKEQSEEEEEVDVPDTEEEDDTDDTGEMPDEMGGLDTDDEEEIDTDDTDDESDEMGDEMDTDMGDEMDTDMGDEDFGSEDDDEEEDVLDMTGASDGEVLKVFRAMKPEDGIVVKKDGNKIEVNTGDDEFIIKLDDEASEVEDDYSDEEEDDFEVPGEEEEDDEMPSDEELAEEESENVYEIEIDEECGDLEECGDKSMPEEEMKEAARTKWNPHGDKGGMNRAGLKSKKVFKAGSGQMNEELETLKKQNEEYRKALKLFKEKLNEVAVFNANLAYATRLFTEQSTTKQEKLNILKRFDSASTLTESKNLYKTIKTELDNKKPITETVINKISNTPSTSTSKEILSETKVYESPQFARVKELMRKMK